MLPWGGLSCCLSAAALYILGRSSGRDANMLNSVTRVNQLKELAQLLDIESKVLPVIVAISGRVGSEIPIKSENSALRGVIVEETVEQHFLKHNDAGSWIQDSALMLSMSKEVPWYLGDGTGRVLVVGAREATGFALTVGSEVFEESGRSLVRGTLDYLQGLKMLGVKRIERVLPTGTSLTVVGEAIKDDIGTIRIQRPHKGPFYVSPKSIDDLIANLGKWARWYKYASMGLTVFGVYLIAKRAIQYIMERRRRRELQKKVLTASAKRSGKGSNEKAENGSDSTKRDRLMPDLCVICLEQEYNAVFVPCGHMCCCTTCSSHLTNCPLCRRWIEQIINWFITCSCLMVAATFGYTQELMSWYAIKTRSQEVQPTPENIEICSNHENCVARPAQIKLSKGFSAREPVKGHMVNVVKGLKLYEDIFTDSELSKLTDFVNELRAAGQNGELSGETFILFNKQIKGNKRELIQFGVPIFGHVKDEASRNNQACIESIPALLQDVIDHLVQWELLPEYKRPNSCIINFFDEGEYSQPFLKPPHLDQPISTLLLSESTMAFGRILVSDTDGNYKGPMMISLKEGSLLVMRGNSADMARHVMCPSPNKRISITFFRVRSEANQDQSPTSPSPSTAMTLWQPGVPSPHTMPNEAPNGYGTIDAMPKWGVLRAPVVMLAPVHPMVLSPRNLPRGGTGVFLPWTVGSRKPAKHLPPRAQRGRLLALPAPVDTHLAESTSEPGISV